MKYSLRSLRFSIRDLLWLMVVVGLALGWWMDRTRMREEVRREVDRVYLLLENRAPGLYPPKNQSGPHIDP